MDFVTQHAILIIENDFKLYQNRKVFKNSKNFKNFYQCKKEIFSYVEIEKVNWNQVFEYFQEIENLFQDFTLGGIKI